ncbi:MAG: hypothetical protein HYX92_12385 [Chloroflexi bacterium]|nr:hypothetical protein [Chloroflexota bacterium]
MEWQRVEYFFGTAGVSSGYQRTNITSAAISTGGRVQFNFPQIVVLPPIFRDFLDALQEGPPAEGGESELAGRMMQDEGFRQAVERGIADLEAGRYCRLKG